MRKRFLKMKRIGTRLVLILFFIPVVSLFYYFTPDNGRTFTEFRIKHDRIDPAFIHSPEQWADSVMNTFSLKEKIAQMIMIAAYSNNNRSNEEEVTKTIRSEKIGGLIFFQGSPYHQAELTNYYQKISRVPLIIAMDAEWGLGMRLDSTISYPRQMMLGAIRNDGLIYDMGVQIAGQLKRLGVQINFAPVADVNNNAENPVINSRSFGEDRANVTSKAALYMKGLQENGIIAVAKHFPGHGDTDVDSHLDLPVIRHTRNRLDSLELFPFKTLINSGVAGIMTAHLYVPALDSLNNTPSSLSGAVIDTLLKKELGFKGLIFTDAMNMQGITHFFSPEEAVEKAVLAGNDILLMPGDVSMTINTIAKMVRNDIISEDEIDARCKKILLAKYWSGLNNYRQVDLNNLDAELNSEPDLLLQRKLVESSLTVLENKNSILPFQKLDTLEFASIAFGVPRDSAFQHALELYAPVRQIVVSDDVNDRITGIQDLANQANMLIVSIHSNDIRANTFYGVKDDVINIIDSLALTHHVVLNLFVNPYILNRFKDPERFDAIVVCYENTPVVQDLTAQFLFGATGAAGMLPVSAANWKALLSGLEIKPIGRLKYSLPLSVGLNADTLKKIDDIVLRAIQEQAMPGCEILVARKGTVVMNNAYGDKVYHNDSRPVRTTDLYDLASVTKVAATLPVLMKLYDDGVIDINEKLSEYLPYLKNTDKKNLVIRDILLHQARLQAWLPFYYSLLEPVFTMEELFSDSLSSTYALKIGAGQFINRFTYYGDRYISTVQTEHYPLAVANRMYIGRNWTDSIYLAIAKSPLRSKAEYLYSDLGFYLFKMMMDTLTGNPLDKLADEWFYKKLGASRLCFNPLNKFPLEEIVPTENDQVFRKQLIQGYVHDPGAAMMGGVSGHAGLFSDANELAKLFQMYLNGGEYAGEHYIDKKTIDLFTAGFQGVKDNRRGLGFDKPEPDTTKPGPTCISASLSSYGHSGFTGTYVWSDPEYDLTYVFLSNRVYPDQLNEKLVEENIRTNIQEMVYHAIMDKKPSLEVIPGE